MSCTSSNAACASSGPIAMMLRRSPPAKNVFFADVITTPVIESFSSTRRSTVAFMEDL